MKSFVTDRRGNIAVIATRGIPVFAGSLALGTEAWYWLVQKSQLSTTTDAISVSAAKMRHKNVSIDKVGTVLKASMVANGYPPETVVDVTYPDAQTITVNTSFPAEKYFNGAVFDGAITTNACNDPGCYQ